MEETSKEKLNLIFMGNVGCGKATLVSQLMCRFEPHKTKYKSFFQTFLNSRDKYESSEDQRIDISHVLRKTQEERERHLTIYPHFLYFETETHIFNIIEAPVHKSLFCGFNKCCWMGDIGVLLTSAALCEHDIELTSASKTLFCCKLACISGIQKLIVLLNKMDLRPTQDYFNSLSHDISKFLRKMGIRSFIIIPISALNYENIDRPISKKMSWYNGPTFIEALESYNASNCESIFRNPNTSLQPFQMPVYRNFNVSNVGTIIAGCVQSGTLKIGDKIVASCAPNKSFIVESIQSYNKDINEAQPGDFIGIRLSNLEDSKIVSRSLLGSINFPSLLFNYFVADIFHLSPTSLSVGEYSFFVHCTKITCKLERIISLARSPHRKLSETNLSSLETYELGKVLFQTRKPIALVRRRYNKKSSSFAIFRNSKLFSIGYISKVIMPWDIKRLLFIAFKKESPLTCHLSKLPKEILLLIISFIET